MPRHAHRRNARSLASIAAGALALAAVALAQGCSGTSGRASMGASSIPEDFRNAPIESFGPAASYEQTNRPQRSESRRGGRSDRRGGGGDRR